MTSSPDPAHTLLQTIRQADQQRRLDALRLKYQLMRQSCFRFYRATPYLFNHAWSHRNATNDYPLSWGCGDLHLENMGSYRGTNGLVYYDINDFDEAQLAPCTLDLARLVTSLFVAAKDWQLPTELTLSLAWQLIVAYKRHLLGGKPRSIERQTARGVLKRFLEQVASRSSHALLNRFTRGHGRHRRLKRDGVHLLSLASSETDTLWPWLEQVVTDYGGGHLRDLAFRIAGTSSLGLTRYAALVQTKKGRYKLLDFKVAAPPVGQAYWGAWQPSWPDDATRIVQLQERLQDVSPRYLQSLVGPGGESLVMRSLQPQADRLTLELIPPHKGKRLAGLLETVAQLLASAQLRSGGQQGSAITDELVAFARQPGWDTELLQQAQQLAQQVEQDYQQFCGIAIDDLLF